MQFYTTNNLLKWSLLFRNMFALIFWVQKSFLKSNPVSPPLSTHMIFAFKVVSQIYLLLWLCSLLLHDLFEHGGCVIFILLVPESRTVLCKYLLEECWLNHILWFLNVSVFLKSLGLTSPMGSLGRVTPLSDMRHWWDVLWESRSEEQR